MLDDEKGGRFQIALYEKAAAGNARVRQFYVAAADTNILLTRFLSPDGVTEVMDLMPTPEMQNAHRVVRIVKTVRGRP